MHIVASGEGLRDAECDFVSNDRPDTVVFGIVGKVMPED
jgi:hypothetical protein